MKNWLTQATGVARQRWDIGYHAFHQANFLERWSSKSNLVPLGEVICEDSYGILTPGDVYAPDLPVTYVRVTDMRTNMEVDYEQTLRVPEEYYRHARARLRKHDVLLAVKGASIASDKSVAFVEEPFPAHTIVNGTIFRFQVKKGHNPFFVAVMLDSEILKRQIRDLQISNNAVSYVDKPSIHALRIPFPPRAVQDRIAQLMQDAYAARRAKLAEAQQLRSNLDQDLLRELGIMLGKQTNKKHFLVQSSGLTGRRFDVGPYANDFTTTQDNAGYPLVALHALAQLPREAKIASKKPSQEFAYIGMSDVNEVTGEVNVQRLVGNRIRANKTRFRGGDIVFARIEPCIYNRKIALVPTDIEEALGSTEFLVARPKEGMSSEFLLLLLRSELVQRQIAGKMTGTTGRRRLPHTAFANLTLPLVPIDVQRRVADALDRCRQRAKVLEREAEAVIIDAKTRVERMILGEESVQ
ncbi:MAG: restriction endonuclease subunit S [Chloroflexi bacterium]|nr:restriction endonuclease subunit S [Chloroflexota bacterium]